ncbi:Reverse gyrase [Thermofilum pendens Hrk 5]|uniref:Reverse gyrase n=2 Tax=Thermofilum pendens TaxID=2269 RepID=A1RXQ0_THEPD|nr:Reverse gyrase [Thermofilum pendens Hrk 5]
MKALYKSLCPNCHGDISDFRLEKRLPCRQCLPEKDAELFLSSETSRAPDPFFEHLERLVKVLGKSGKLLHLEELYSVERDLADFQAFFRKAVGSRPWSAQKTWARRVLRNTSFVILAPTGVGKTVFGIVMALFLASRGKKSYIVLPTTTLAQQVFEKATLFARKVAVNEGGIVVYHGGLPQSKKEEVLSRVSGGDFSVLITTSQFLSRNFDKLERVRFDFVFVDDVDSIIKSSKNIDRILRLLGFTQDEISVALEIIRERVRLARRLRNGASTSDVYERLEELRRKLAEYTGKGGPRGVLVVSTATGRPRGLRIRLFRELLGFEIGSRGELFRNVVDTYVVVDRDEEVVRQVATLASRLGRGGLVFAPAGTGEEFLESLAEALEKSGLRVGRFYGNHNKRKLLEEFSGGNLDVLVGVASYYGTLVRGLDLPHVVRYAIFAGIPHFKFSIKLEDVPPLRLLQIASNVRVVASRDDQAVIDRLVAYVRNWLQNMEPGEYMALTQCLSEGSCHEKYSRLVESINHLRSIVEKYLSSKEYLERLSKETSLTVVSEDGQLKLLLPDVLTYIQASGRTSRLYARGVSKGLSIVVTGNGLLFEKFAKFSRLYSSDIEWKPLSEVDLDLLVREIDEEREIIRRILSGEVSAELAGDLVKSVLVVVESPTKARTIASFFGKPSRRRVGPLVAYDIAFSGYILTIVATQGHIFDLTTNAYSYNSSKDLYGVLVLDAYGASKHYRFVPVFNTIKRCMNCGAQFTEYAVEDVPRQHVQKVEVEKRCPRCGSTNVFDKAEIVEALRKLASEVEEVFVATDPDTEGEKIAWDVYLSLAPYVRVIKRVEFHEVTRRAFEEALRNPRSINDRMVEAQLVRRIEDRWLGFSLSQKLQECRGHKWLSAGRVQTPVLGWIVENSEKARRKKVVFILELSRRGAEGEKLRVIVDNARLDGQSPAAVSNKIKEEGVTVSIVSREEKTLPPPPPFTTDTLLREANQVLGLDVDRTMRIAQDLFESGLITYHRTDSTRVSDLGISVARTYITERFSEEYFAPRRWGEGGAHECIRPTRPLDVDSLMQMIRQGILQVQVNFTRDHIRLYDLIFRRFIASQMPPAKVVEAKAVVKGPYFEKEITFIESIIEKAEGFTKILPLRTRQIPEGKYDVLLSTYKRVSEVPLYTQADVIRLMKERNIGRPSTYSKIVRTLLDRNYVVEVKGGRLVSTRLGKKVYEFLSVNFGDVVSENKTADVLRRMDEIEEGRADYLDVLAEFYEEVQSKVIEKNADCDILTAPNGKHLEDR